MNAVLPPKDPDRPPLSAVDRRVWLGVLGCFRPYRGAVALALAAILLGTLLGLLPPLLVAGLIDHAIPAGKTTESAAPLVPYVLGLVLAPLLASLISWVQQYVATRVGQGILSDLRQRLFTQLQKQSLRFFVTTRGGEITSRVADDVSAIRWAVSETLPEIVGNLVMVAGTLAVLFLVSWPLALAASATPPAFLLPPRPLPNCPPP